MQNPRIIGFVQASSYARINAALSCDQLQELYARISLNPLFALLRDFLLALFVEFYILTIIRKRSWIILDRYLFWRTVNKIPGI